MTHDLRFQGRTDDHGTSSSSSLICSRARVFAACTAFCVLLSGELCAQRKGLGAQKADAKASSVDATADAELVRALLPRLAKPRLRSKALQRVVLLGRRAVKPLTAELANPSKGVRAADVLAALGELGPYGVPAIPGILAFVKKATPDELVPATRALADLVPFEAVDGHLRRVSFRHTILVLRSRAKDRALKNRIGLEVHRFMLRSQVTPDLDVADLVELIEKNQIFVRTAAAEQLGLKGAKAESALAVLVGALEERNKKPIGWDWHARFGRPGAVVKDRFVERAMDAVIAIAPSDRRATLAWALRLRRASDFRARVRASRMLGKMREAVLGEGIDALIAALDDPHPRVARAALLSLGELGRFAKKSRPALLKRREAADAQGRKVIDAVLAKIPE